MSRVSRYDIKNESNIYHIILRGVNKQNIFLENYDRTFFLNKLEKTKDEYNSDIYTFVLMNNHVHLVIYDKENTLSKMMHSICTSYARYFNETYNRCGHLFQNRFKSIGVNSDRYLLNLIRYVHKNPEKEGIAKMEDYEWSGYQEYLGKKKIVNTEFVLEMFDENKTKAIEKFFTFNKGIEREYSDAEFECEKMTDDEAVENIKRLLEIDNLQNIQRLNKELQKEYIQKISKIKGIYVKQISRILGIDKNIIYELRKGAGIPKRGQAPIRNK